jgi:hypothetical protein
MWFHEFEELEAAKHHEGLHALKSAVDGRIAQNPDGPPDASDNECYTQTLAPAAQRHNDALLVEQKTKAQLMETWGAGWEDIIGPGMLQWKLSCYRWSLAVEGTSRQVSALTSAYGGLRRHINTPKKYTPIVPSLQQESRGRINSYSDHHDDTALFF